MPHKVIFSPEADRQLRALGRFIAEKNSTRIAETYLTRIVLACYDLHTLPHRGTQRNDLLPGLRTIGFERRATIAFRVKSDTVEILAFFYGGQSLKGYFNGLNNESTDAELG